MTGCFAFRVGVASHGVWCLSTRCVDRFNRIDDERKRAAQERRDKKFKER